MRPRKQSELASRTYLYLGSKHPLAIRLVCPSAVYGPPFYMPTRTRAEDYFQGRHRGTLCARGFDGMGWEWHASLAQKPIGALKLD